MCHIVPEWYFLWGYAILCSMLIIWVALRLLLQTLCRCWLRCWESSRFDDVGKLVCVIMQ